MPTRREFLRRSSGAAALAVLAPSSLATTAAEGAAARRLIRGARFNQGLLSGDPTPTGITLLTVLDEVSRSGSVRLEVARDAGFRNVVGRKTIATRGAIGHSVKARVTGLRPDERYYYRFETADEQSEVGRFQTALPPDSQRPVRFGFFSCADYTHGYYNAYELMARDDLDFVVNLGDYIYAETYHQRGRTGVRTDTIGSRLTGNPDVPYVATTLGHYRDKYALYRTDKSLRKLHASTPMVSIWDDHEVVDNYAGAAPKGGLPAAKDAPLARKRAGYQAFFENMPFFPSGRSRIYRALPFGSNVDLIMLDQRQYRGDQPCNDATVPPCEGFDRPNPYLGRTQLNWLKRRLESSKAAWKVIGNEALVMPAKVTGGSFYGFDSWQGYPGEREELLQFIKAREIDDVVFVTGDIHTFIAGDVRTRLGEGETVALEFVGGSITSQNFGETDLDVGGGIRLQGNDANPRTDPAIIQTLRGLNPWVDEADFDHHGYGMVKASKAEFDVTLKRVRTIKRRSTATLPDDGFRWRVARGQKSIKGVNGPDA
jgi:alkaline phosphatase D